MTTKVRSKRPFLCEIAGAEPSSSTTSPLPAGGVRVRVCCEVGGRTPVSSRRAPGRFTAPFDRARRRDRRVSVRWRLSAVHGRGYERTLEGLLEDLGADVALERISRARLETHLRDRYGTAAPTTYNRNLATIGSLFRGRGHRRDRRRQPRNSRRRSEATP